MITVTSAHWRKKTPESQHEPFFAYFFVACGCIHRRCASNNGIFPLMISIGYGVPPSMDTFVLVLAGPWQCPASAAERPVGAGELAGTPAPASGVNMSWVVLPTGEWLNHPVMKHILQLGK